ncbi:MAG: TetR/AcrR family transcriptional regulator [Alphaproteobacteria bacterium]|nr:TetR/AcrR family transcriptional regulator [Alphaproteobacteria bacterium]
MTDEPESSESVRFRRRAGARPTEVLDAALQCFMRDGFEATRVEDIAKVAGISKATVYLYFPSKLALLEGLIHRAVSPVAKMAKTSILQFEGSAQDAIKIVLRIVCTKISDPDVSAIPLIVMREAGRFPDIAQYYYDEVISQILPALIAVVDRGIASGELRDVDANLSVGNIIGPLVVYMLLATVFKTGDLSPKGLDAFLSNHIDVLFHGLVKGSPKS